jgi:Guanylate kinase
LSLSQLVPLSTDICNQVQAVRQVPVFHFLTSWPTEDLVSPLNGINAHNGELFDRLEAAVKEHTSAAKRSTVTCAHLKVRKQSERPPPRVLVFTGPPGAGKRKVMQGLVKAEPNLFAQVVTHTSRQPKEHEVDGAHYHFTDMETIR